MAILAARQGDRRPKAQEAFWQGTLGYPQAVVLVCFAFGLGLALHGLIGYRIPTLQNPVIWLIALSAPVSLVAGRIGRKNRVVHWLSGIPMAVCVTVAVGLLALVGGVVPQSTIQERFHAETIWASWPFLLLVTLMVANLLGSVGKRCWPLTYTNFVYLAAHAGLAIAIIGGAVSALLLERDVMVLFPGQATDKAMKPDGAMVNMPFSIELKEFHLKTFPPVLALATLDPKSEGGIALKPGEAFVKSGLVTKIGDVQIRVKRYYPKAIYAAKGWQEAPWKTAAPAALIEATLPNGTTHSGWVSCGAVDAPQEHLRIAEELAIVMPGPRPKEFRSDIRVVDGGRSEETSVKVNEPLNRRGWTVYQLSYDDKAGAASAYSTLEVVRDPGIGVVYFGMGLLVLGSCLHLWNGVSKGRGA